MNETALVLIITVLVLAAVAVAAWFLIQRQRHERLRRTYGPDYERNVARLGSPERADEDLIRRERVARKLDAKPLSPVDRDRFTQRWRVVQSDFVERPQEAISEADKLLNEVMRARGYPIDDEMQRHANLNVGHPEMVNEYRSARDIAERAHDGAADTEDLRRAMIHYRNLFGSLLGEEGRRPM